MFRMREGLELPGAIGRPRAESTARCPRPLRDARQELRLGLRRFRQQAGSFPSSLKGSEVHMSREVLLARLRQYVVGIPMVMIRAQSAVRTVRREEFFRVQSVIKREQSALLQ